MRRPQGYAQLLGPGLSGLSNPGLASLNKWGECDTFTCAHCQALVHVPVGRGPEAVGGYCRSCDSIICVACADKQVCTPVEAELERKLTNAERMKWLRS